MKKLIIAEKAFVAGAIVLALRNQNDPFINQGGYYENSEYLVTWAASHLFRLDGTKNQSLHVLDEKSLDDYFSRMSLCPDWEFAFVGKEAAGFFQTIQSLLDREDVDTVISAGDSDADGEICIRTILHMAGCQKTILRAPTIVLTEALTDFIKSSQPIEQFDDLAREGYRNMLRNYVTCNPHFQVGLAMQDQVTTTLKPIAEPQQSSSALLKQLTSGYCCSYCGVHCKDEKNQVNLCSSFVPTDKFRHELTAAVLYEAQQR